MALGFPTTDLGWSVKKTPTRTGSWPYVPGGATPQVAIATQYAKQIEDSLKKNPNAGFSGLGTDFSGTPGYVGTTFGQEGGGGGGEAKGTPAPYDPSIDYLYGQKDQDMARRRAARDNIFKRRLLAFGSRELARKYFGDSDPFVSMVSDDPSQSNSFMAEANRRMKLTLRNTSEMLGHQYGLWNSSGRNEALSDIGREHTSTVQQQTSALEDELSGVESGVSDAEKEWMQRIFEARYGAWQRGASNHGF